MLSFIIKVEVGNKRSWARVGGRAFFQVLMRQDFLIMIYNVCAHRIGLENLKTKTGRPGNPGKR